MKKTLFLSAILGAVFAASAMADTTYQWDSTNSTWQSSVDGGEWTNVAFTSQTLNNQGTFTPADAATSYKVVRNSGDWAWIGESSRFNAMWIDSGRTNFKCSGSSTPSGTMLVQGGALTIYDGTEAVTSYTLSNDFYLGTSTFTETADAGVFNHVAIRLNDSAVFNGTVTLTQSIVQISGWSGADATFNTVIGAGKTLSIGANTNATSATFNGGATLGTLSIGTKLQNATTISGTKSNYITTIIKGENTINNINVVNGSLDITGSTTLTSNSIAISAGAGMYVTDEQYADYNGHTTGDGKVYIRQDVNTSTAFDAQPLDDTKNYAFVGSGTQLLTYGTGSGSYTGNIMVDKGVTLKLNGNNAYRALDGTVTVAVDAALDFNGIDINAAEPDIYSIVLAGGKLTNSGNSLDDGRKQIGNLTLTANSTLEVNASKDYSMLGNGWGATTMNLGGLVLEKTGAGNFKGFSTTVSNGTLKLSGGTFTLGATAGGAMRAGAIGGNTTIELAGGSLAGQFTTNANATFKASANGTISAVITNTGRTATFNVDNDKTLTLSGSLTGGALTKEGGGTQKITGTLASIGTMTLSGGKLSLDNGSTTGITKIWMNGASLDLTTASTANVTGILFGYKDSGGAATTLNIADGTTFHVSGTAAAGDTSNGFIIWNGYGHTFNVDGSLEIDHKVYAHRSTGSGTASKATFNVGSTGQLTMAEGIDFVSSLAELTSLGTINVNGGTLAIGGQTTGSKATVNLADGAKVTAIDAETSTGQEFTVAANATITLSGKGTEGTADHHLTVNSAINNSTATLNTLGNVTVQELTVKELAVDGSLTISHEAATTMNSLTLNGGTITIGSADNGGHDYDLTTTDLTVSGTGSTMNANLVIADGGTLDFSSGAILTMGCDVTISGSEVTVVIDSSELASIQQGNELTLITGIDTLNLNDAITVHFKGQNDQSLAGYGLRLEQGKDGKSLVVTPEPATATLSLLALAGLAARRRRH